jgi:hypothetical protein
MRRARSSWRSYVEAMQMNDCRPSRRRRHMRRVEANSASHRDLPTGGGHHTTTSPTRSATSCDSRLGLRRSLLVAPNGLALLEERGHALLRVVRQSVVRHHDLAVLICLVLAAIDLGVEGPFPGSDRGST